VLVQDVIARLKALGGLNVHEVSGREENIVFEVPKELRVNIRQVD
jgi:4-hydroxy-3-methylbut-2-en-1-yl diphosphate reductase